MKFAMYLLGLLPLAFAAPFAKHVEQPREAADVGTDGEAIVRVIRYNADLIERNSQGGESPTLIFPKQYSADIIESS